MKLCIRPHDIGKDMSADDLGEKIGALGFDGVQLAIAKAIRGNDGSPEALTPDAVREIRAGFNSHGVEIPVLGAYFNPVHSNKEKVRQGSRKFADHLKKARDFGATLVASETGSYNDDKWTYNPKNQTDEAFNEVVSVFAPLAQAAKEAGALLSAEGAWHHCIYSPEQMARFLREIDTGAVRVTVDVLNYLYIGNYEQRRSIFDKCLELFLDKIAIFHIKDFVVQDGKLVEVGIGKGIMGWDTFLPEIKKNVPNAILVFEGVKDLDESLAYFRSLMETL